MDDILTLYRKLEYEITHTNTHKHIGMQAHTHTHCMSLHMRGTYSSETY